MKLTLREIRVRALAAPLELRNGQALIAARPGIGPAWDEKAVKRYAI